MHYLMSVLNFLAGVPAMPASDSWERLQPRIADNHSRLKPLSHGWPQIRVSRFQLT
jgi:hypothetical protein